MSGIFAHHAYLLEGPLQLFEPLLENVREMYAFAPNAPGRVARTYEKFGIDEARSLAALSSLKSTNGRALFVVAAASMSSEAQQALLKIFEEPQQGTAFVLLLPYGVLIATLRSRTLPYPHTLEALRRERAQAKKFLGASRKDRSAQVVAMLKDEEGARERVREFLDILEQELYGSVEKTMSTETREGLEDIARFRHYLSDRAPSLKMILEHFAVALPKLPS